MPGKFYTWLTKQKMVIDAFDGLKEVSTYRDENYYYQPTVSPDQITVDDAAWGIHGGRYVRFTPLRTTTNNSATYSCAKVVPGVRYRLLIIFAPETVYDDEEAKLPTLVRVTANGSIQADRQEVSATEVTTLDLPDFSTKVMGLDLKIETCVTSAQIRNKKYNRILRIAQIRLTPIEEE